MIAEVSDPGRARRFVGDLVDAELDDHAVIEAAARIVWGCIVEPGDRTAGRLIAARGAKDALGAAVSASELAPTPLSSREWRDAYARWKPRLAAAGWRDAAEVAHRAGARLLTPGSPSWPSGADHLGDHAPVCLWVRGDPSLLAAAGGAVALVGARAASGYGEHVTAELSGSLASDGIAIVSGAAYGIDGVAHRAALGVHGQTFALLAGGVDRPYPAGHAELIGRVAASGLVISEVAPGSAPTKWRFLQRNRLIAALSDATVVVEAGWRSGSLNTAGHAAALGRPLGAVPGPITSAASSGCHRLLREFDARCITGADDVRELLGIDHSGATPTARSGRTDDRTRVQDALSTRVWRGRDDIARRAGMAPTDVEGLLALLQLDGEVERGADGWRMLSRAPSAR